MLRWAVVLALFACALAPVAQAGASAAEQAAHACCPDRTPPPDAASPCHFSTAFTCCAPATVPPAASDSLPAFAWIFAASATSAPPVAQLALRAPPRALARPPDVPPLWTTVLQL